MSQKTLHLPSQKKKKNPLRKKKNLKLIFSVSKDDIIFAEPAIQLQ